MEGGRERALAPPPLPLSVTLGKGPPLRGFGRNAPEAETGKPPLARMGAPFVLGAENVLFIDRRGAR